jgi:uncharacterized RDD family membrane protein YckC
MSGTYSEMLKANYEKMHTDFLIEIKVKGGLTEEATKLLDAELKKRNIKEVEIKAYVDSDEENYKPDDFAEDIKLGNLASTGRRYLAQLVDQLIAVALTVIVVLLVSTYEISGILGLLTYASYILFNDAMPNGQSFGKKLLSIKVVNKTTGKNCNIKEALLRNITTVIPFLAFIDAVMIFGVKKQRMGDKIANTLVIKA